MQECTQLMQKRTHARTYTTRAKTRPCKNLHNPCKNAPMQERTQLSCKTESTRAVAYLGFHKEGAEFLLAKCLHKGGPNHVFLFFPMAKNKFLTKGMAPLNMPLNP